MVFKRITLGFRAYTSGSKASGYNAKIAIFHPTDSFEKKWPFHDVLCFPLFTASFLCLPLLPLNFSRYLVCKCQKGTWHYKALELHKVFRELLECHKSISQVQMTLFQSSVTVHLGHTHNHYWFISDVHTRLLWLTYMFNESLPFRGIELFDVCSQEKVLTACHVLSVISLIIYHL